jgi:S-adenosylmethionine:tRNA ribosyltransferase-isomerase
MKTTDFDYALPPELIATVPAPRRDESRLMVLGRRDGQPVHSTFRQFAMHLPPRTVIVLNDTRVMPARLHGKKPTGGAIEVLLLRRLDGVGVAGGGDLASSQASSQVWEAIGRNLGRATPGTRLTFEGDLLGELIGHEPGDLLRLRLWVADERASVSAHLERIGELPLPPYIEAARRRDAEVAPKGDAGGGADLRALDRERYQTVYAREPGAVAAPTAGLHFTPELLGTLAASGHTLARLTLHVGPGTFRPVKTDEAEDHPMDAEWYTIPADTAALVNAARGEGRPVLAVGTTVVRALEAAARGDDEASAPVDAVRPVRAGAGSTRLYLRPGASFHVVTDLLTNFHLPRSTLLMLVSAFAGRERVLGAYRAAVEAHYRFYSYGDAMLIRGTP